MSDESDVYDSDGCREPERAGAVEYIGEFISEGKCKEDRMRRVRWGVIGTAKIGTLKVIPAMKRGDFCEMVGIASRDLAKARAVADEFGFPKAYGSYEEMVADPDIEAVYIPLPNHLHVPWSVKALEAGKHVLCEKPIGMSVEEAQQLLEVSKRYPHLKVMEAFMYRHHPQWQKARELAVSGTIGELKTTQMFVSYLNLDPENVRNKADIGGGGLMDVGCYCISMPRFMFGAEPERVAGIMEYDPNFGTDRVTSAMMDFGGGRTATWTCSTQLPEYQRFKISGSKGHIEVEVPINAAPDRPSRIWVQVDEDREDVTFSASDQYTIQGDMFSQAVINDTPVFTPLEDAVANMKVIEAVARSASKGSWETV
jgi:predicted dehydrogenase